jgi:hypothetical protein
MIKNVILNVTTQSLIFSTTDQGNKRIGAKAALCQTKATLNELHILSTGINFQAKVSRSETFA